MNLYYFTIFSRYCQASKIYGNAVFYIEIYGVSRDGNSVKSVYVGICINTFVFVNCQDIAFHSSISISTALTGEPSEPSRFSGNATRTYSPALTPDKSKPSSSTIDFQEESHERSAGFQYSPRSGFQRRIA